MQKVSLASSAQSYRTDAARHVYNTYANQIYKGMLPPLVHAIVVIETEVDKAGNVRDVRVIRAPSHAPDVTKRVVAMVHKASPFPEPSKLGATKFMEVWMVDRGGHFQVHTLTEGQL